MRRKGIYLGKIKYSPGPLTKAVCVPEDIQHISLRKTVTIDDTAKDSGTTNGYGEGEYVLEVLIESMCVYGEGVPL